MFHDFLDRLYEDIGTKIKNLAKWMFLIEAVSAILTGLFFIFSDEDTIIYGLLTILFGPVAAWISTWLLYAFGDLVENSQATVSGLHKISKNLAHTEPRTKQDRSAPIKQEAEAKAAQVMRAHTQYSMKADAQVVKAPAPQSAKPEAQLPTPAKTEATVSPLPKAPKATPAEKTLAEKLSYALSYQTDDGMINYLKRIDDETVARILEEPPHVIRGLVEDALKRL